MLVLAACLFADRLDEFLELAARSGCKQLFVGLESISQASLDEVAKGFNRVDGYARAIERIHAHGIAVQAGIVFGFDHDTEAVFDETLEFLETAGVQNATFNILTPFPGTRLHQRLEAEGRILTRDWSRYNGRADVVYQPRHMSPEALLRGYQREPPLLLLAEHPQTPVALAGPARVDPAAESRLRPRSEAAFARRGTQKPSWRAASSFMISSAPPPIALTFTSR